MPTLRISDGRAGAVELVRRADEAMYRVKRGTVDARWIVSEHV